MREHWPEAVAGGFTFEGFEPYCLPVAIDRVPLDNCVVKVTGDGVGDISSIVRLRYISSRYFIFLAYLGIRHLKKLSF